MHKTMSSLWWRDSNQMASGKPGAVHRYAIIVIEVVTRELINVIVRNGRIVDFDYDGTHLGWFDATDDHAAQERRQVLTPDKSI